MYFLKANTADDAIPFCSWPLWCKTIPVLCKLLFVFVHKDVGVRPLFHPAFLRCACGSEIATQTAISWGTAWPRTLVSTLEYKSTLPWRQTPIFSHEDCTLMGELGRPLHWSILVSVFTMRMRTSPNILATLSAVSRRPRHPTSDAVRFTCTVMEIIFAVDELNVLNGIVRSTCWRTKSRFRWSISTKSDLLFVFSPAR